MEESQSPPTSGRRHGRTSMPIVRRNTTGPLDAVDEYDDTCPLGTPAPGASPPDEATQSAKVSSPPQAQANALVDRLTKPALDLRFLQSPSLYHALSTEDVPKAYLDSAQLPPESASLEDLLQLGCFRRAASVAVSQILKSSPSDVEHVFQLLYTRLACLVLVSRPDIAAQEANPLTDLLGRNPAGARDLLPHIPWELRLLLVRLQSVNASDGGRRCVMSLYGLASEVRGRLAIAETTGRDADIQPWKARLEDLGLRVTDSLVEMGELATAKRHLETMVTANIGDYAYRKALLLLKMGDIRVAQKTVDQMETGTKKQTLVALLLIANGEMSSAIEAWRSILQDEPDQAVAVSNMAVSLLYTGDIIGAREVFENAVETLPSFPGLLFNLSTVYELCTERGLELKTALTRRLASKPLGPQSGGWEATNFDLKL
nr:uncharacterized protein LOC112012193 [Quercus suber]